MELRRAVASAVNATDLLQGKALDLQRSNEQLEEQAAVMLAQESVGSVRHSRRQCVRGRVPSRHGDGRIGRVRGVLRAARRLVRGACPSGPQGLAVYFSDITSRRYLAEERERLLLASEVAGADAQIARERCWGRRCGTLFRSLSTRPSRWPLSTRCSRMVPIPWKRTSYRSPRGSKCIRIRGPAASWFTSAISMRAKRARSSGSGCCTPTAVGAGILASAAVVTDLPPLVTWVVATVGGRGAAGLVPPGW